MDGGNGKSEPDIIWKEIRKIRREDIIRKKESVGKAGRIMKKVITYGSFDLFHEGHYRLLKRAKELGDYLMVGVTTEQYDRLRGKLNVEEPLLTRVENIKNRVGR